MSEEIDEAKVEAEARRWYERGEPSVFTWEKAKASTKAEYRENVRKELRRRAVVATPVPYDADKDYFVISLVGCDDTTHVCMPLTEAERDLLTRLSQEAAVMSDSGCMPTLEVRSVRDIGEAFIWLGKEEFEQRYAAILSGHGVDAKGKKA